MSTPPVSQGRFLGADQYRRRSGRRAGARGTAGIVRLDSGPAGLPGLIGVALLAGAWLFFGVFLSFYSVLVLPSAPLPEAFVVAFLVGLLAWLVGTVLLAVPFIRRRVDPRWVGYLLPASAVWGMVGNLIIAPSGPAANLAVNLVSNLGPVLLLVGIGYLGHRMRSEHAAASTATTVRMPVLFPVFGEAGWAGIFGPIFVLGALFVVVRSALAGYHRPMARCGIYHYGGRLRRLVRVCSQRHLERLGSSRVRGVSGASRRGEPGWVETVGHAARGERQVGWVARNRVRGARC